MFGGCLSTARENVDILAAVSADNLIDSFQSVWIASCYCYSIPEGFRARLEGGCANLRCGSGHLLVLPSRASFPAVKLLLSLW